MATKPKLPQEPVNERPPVSRLKKALRYVQGQLTTLHHREARLQHRIANRRKARKAKKKPPATAVDIYLTNWRTSFKYHLPYDWGGGHVTPAPTPAFLAKPGGDDGYDCSSGACYFDQAVGVKTETGTTFSMAGPPTGLVKGRGKFITHYIKNSPATDAHVITRVTNARGRVLAWCQVGGRDNTRGGGPCFFNPSTSRIAEFPIQVHPRGW